MKSSDMPAWITRWVRRETCVRCRHRYGFDDLVMFGISVKEKNPKVDCFIKLKCRHCPQILTVISPKQETVRDVIGRSQRDFERADQRRLLRLPRRSRPAPPKPQSNRPKINRQDADNLKKLVQDAQTHDDFLRSIGMSQEEIDRLKADPEADKDDDGQK